MDEWVLARGITDTDVTTSMSPLSLDGACANTSPPRRGIFVGLSAPLRDEELRDGEVRDEEVRDEEVRGEEVRDEEVRGKEVRDEDRKSTRLNSSHSGESRMPSSA